MKWLKIFFCAVMVVAIIAVPCYATNEGSYSHYIAPGTYLVDEIPDISMLNLAPNARLTLDFAFSSNGNSYTGLYVAKGASDVVFSYSYLPNYSAVYSSYDGGWINESYRTIDVVDGFYIDDFNTYYFWVANFMRSDSVFSAGLFDEMFGLFTFVGQWISGATDALIPIFWDGEALTFIGTLAVSALALAVSFLIIGLIQRFLKFKG